MGGGVLPHVFIINPAAGHKNAAVWLEPQIRAAAAEKVGRRSGEISHSGSALSGSMHIARHASHGPEAPHPSDEPPAG